MNLFALITSLYWLAGLDGPPVKLYTFLLLPGTEKPQAQSERYTFSVQNFTNADFFELQWDGKSFENFSGFHSISNITIQTHLRPAVTKTNGIYTIQFQSNGTIRP